MNPLSLWSIPMYHFQWNEHNKYRDDLMQLCRDLEDKKITSGVASNAKYGLYESAFDFAKQDNDAVRAWADWAKYSIFQAAKHSAAGSWLPGSNITVELHESWCHITRDGGYHDIHIHPNSSWSAVYYLDCGDMDIDTKNGVNRFFRPYQTSYTDAGTEWMNQSTTIDITPAPGTMIVFPSWIPHSGLPYRGSRERYILSFNSKVNYAQ